MKSENYYNWWRSWLALGLVFGAAEILVNVLFGRFPLFLLPTFNPKLAIPVGAVSEVAVWVTMSLGIGALTELGRRIFRGPDSWHFGVRVTALLILEAFVVRMLLSVGMRHGLFRVFAPPKFDGGRVITGARLLELGHDENKLVNRVSYEFKGEVASIPAGAVLSTISPHDLSALLRVDLPGKVRGALERLRWRGMRLLYWESPGLRYPDCETYYFPEADYPFGRISVPALFDSSMGRRKSGRLLCIELPCGEGEEIWSAADRSLFSLLISSLRQAGVIAGEGREETSGTIFSVKERRIYPLLFVNWRNYFSIVYSWLRTYPNLFPLGRQGLFLHNNMDQSIVMG